MERSKKKVEEKLCKKNTFFSFFSAFASLSLFFEARVFQRERERERARLSVSAMADPQSGEVLQFEQLQVRDKERGKRDR